MARSSASSGVEVFVDALDTAPWCPHGPTLMFERFYQEREPRRFFACSAHRKRSGCSFFQWADEKESASKRQMRMDIYKVARDSEAAHTAQYEDVRSALEKPSPVLSVCTNCACVVARKKPHQEHKVVENLSAMDVLQPTRLLPALEDVSSNAQYLFADKAVTYILNQLHTLDIRHVVCIGAPRLHETVLSSRRTKSSPLCQMNSFLLDWDRRFVSFFSQEEFQHFNMFNHHFFAGDEGAAKLQTFLRGVPMHKVAVVIDPPFGGLARPLAACLDWLYSVAKETCPAVKAKDKPKSVLSSSSDASEQLATVWVFPYFLESQILEAMPAMKMTDYKVDYENHPLFTSVGRKKAEKRKSPVRLFTNMDPAQLILPADESYRLCKPCERYVSAENQHCRKCRSCTTKHGPAYIHCDRCKSCVKPGRAHCATCKQCLPPQHECRTEASADGSVAASSTSPTCHRCGETGHKRRHCPTVAAETTAQKRRHAPSAAETQKSQGPPAKRKRKSK